LNKKKRLQLNPFISKFFFFFSNKIKTQMMNNIPIELDHIILKKFSIIDLKGQGAYGTVWKVKDKNSRKIFALKKVKSLL
jgi:serine/threonine protein kinase